MSQKTQQDSMPIAEAVDLPEISVEHSTEFLTGSAPCAGVSRPLPAAWLGQRGIYRSRFEAVCNGEQLVDPLTLGELIQRAWPSPSTELAERGTQHRFSTTKQTCRHDFYGVWWNDSGVTKTGRECRHCGFFVADMTEGAAEHAEVERPEGTADLLAIVREAVAGAYNEWKMISEAVTEIMEAHERIVGELRAENAKLSEALNRLSIIRARLNLRLDYALDKISKLESRWPHGESPEERFEHYISNTIDRAPEPLRRLGNWLSHVLDEDQWTTAERMLTGACVAAEERAAAQTQHSVPDGLRELLEMLVVSDLRKIRYAGAWRREVHNRASSILALLAAAPGNSVPQAWLDVQAERRRQVEAEGWTPQHDDEHADGQMAQAAGCYALHAGGIGTDWPDGRQNGSALFWPWDKDWWKPTTPRRDLVKACALALAEIERLDRAAATQGGPSDA
ncbi:TPA: hypothetical protein ACXI4C_000104 [Pseudomonas aeruginosa]|uniref:hypothetical protein n=1 Tax=Pseudomonas aeruginosa TaxID=287 RepID=UPI000BB8E7C7|nr:hypothetical protein [Pseudomonas aeruginosa]MDY1089145.1 hypothetical protein [Pseudomonas aeruginosa]PBZ70752.1 hypothetical protein CJU53_18750 [Pseudomonas aeruginosa]PBZ76872.1 hypothetical protein CJU52_18750 [Pseudomonas aeruginosa]PBZ82839.1 hypothetical protein CJU51_19285 [Pseudomonas aeruginosa]HBP4910426.1 hypothetical protein [Pseudomonas aeruginosa]